MRLNQEFMGNMLISPEHDVIAGEFSTWTFTFTAGEYGVDDRGSLRIAWRSVSDWDTPQFTEPSEPGYTTVHINGNAKANISFAKFERPFGNSILVDIHHGYLKKGDQIIVTMGERAEGGPGIRAQSFCEKEHEFRVFLDPCGTARYEELPNRPVIRIGPAYPHEIQAIVPGTVICGEPFDLVVRCLDAFGNVTDLYEGEIELSVPQLKHAQIPNSVKMQKKNGGVLHIKDCVIEEEGVWNLRLIDKKKEFKALSNASLASLKPAYRLFWGDMHGQTNFTIGTGSLDEYYSFARDKAAVDFTGWQGNDFEINDTKWNKVREKTKEYNSAGNFLVFLGYEWSGITPQGGDHNVYFLEDNATFHPSSNWTSRTDVDPALNANPVSQLWDIFKGRNDVMLIPHIGGRYGNLDYCNPNFTSVIEIHSHHGTFEWFAMEAMKRRLKVGFIASSDDHTCRPGLSYPLSGRGKSSSGAFDVASGFSGVYAKELTKEAIWEAIKARRCYASSFDRIFMDIEVSGHKMGEEFTTSDAPELKLKSAGNCPIEYITIYDWDEMVCQSRILSKHSSRVRIRWSGVSSRGRSKSATWDGMLYTEKGLIKNAVTYAFDRLDQGIKLKTDKYVKWTSSTSGDYDGIVLNIDGGEDTILRFTSAQGNVDVALQDVQNGPVICPMGGENLQLEFDMDYADILPQDEIKACQADYACALPAKAGQHAFWVKVTQTNGNSAWSSPVYVTIAENNN